MSLKIFLSKTMVFIMKYCNHPLFIFVYGLNYFRSSFVAGATFFKPEDFVDEIQKGRSFLRFGDGEIHIMNGGSLPSQVYDKKLSLAMRTMTKEYNDDSPYIIGLPRFVNKTNIELKKEAMFFGWLPAKVMFTILFPKKVTYGDAHFFYRDGFFQKYLEPFLLDKHLIVVSNENNVNSLKNNSKIPFKKMSFVTTPKKDSYASYESICKEIETILIRIPKDDKPVIVIAAGPTSKEVVYRFSKKGITAFDIGTGLEVLYKDESLEDMFPKLKNSIV